MSTTQDLSIGLVDETTYKTGVTVSRFYEFTQETFDWAKTIKQGKGLRVGGRVDRSARRAETSAQGKGDFTVEAISKGMGLLWEGCLGAGTSTNVSGSQYQQVFTLADNPASKTIQTGLPYVTAATGAFTIAAHTWLGCMVDSWEFDFPSDDIASLKTTWNMGDLTTATSYATPSYPTSPNLYHFANGSISSGTLTAPTTTALGTGSTTIADVRSGSITVNNNWTIRKNLNGTGRQSKPTVGLRTIAIKLDAEFDSITYRDAIINETPFNLILNFVTGVATDALQIIVPEVKLDGQFPMSNGNDLIVQSLGGSGLDNLSAAQPIWVVMQTLDTAL